MKKWIKYTLIASCAVVSALTISQLTRLEKSSELSSIKGIIPTSSEEIQAYEKKTVELVNQSIDALVNVAPDSLCFSNTILLWDDMGGMLIERLAILKSLSTVGASDKALQDADNAYNRIIEYVKERMISSPKIIMTLIGYLEKALSDSSVTSSQWHYISQLASTIDTSYFPFVFRGKIQMMKDHIASKDTTNFTYLQCGTEEKSLSDSFTLLNLNVCFLPGGLPLLYGGVLPWNDRIQKVADRILSLDADIICLQEVFERRSALGLYEKLKDRYSHFYLDIGPKNFGLTHTDAGLGSGLFVASKLPIKNPSFTPFQKKNENVNRGFFQFDIEKEGLKVARVFTTHLEAFNDKVSQQNRHNQLETIIETMRKQKEVNGNAPLQILCGDLNIPWGSKEPAEDLLQSCFNDSYCHSVTSLCDATRTYVDFTDFWWKAKGQVASFSPQPEILDYAVHLKGEYALPSSPCMITASCAMNDIKQPLQAISDHHGLISWVDISKNLYNCK